MLSSSFRVAIAAMIMANSAVSAAVVPSCAIQCLNGTAAAVTSCSSIYDYDCTCLPANVQKLATAVTPCVIKQCGTSASTGAEQIVAFCAARASPVNEVALIPRDRTVMAGPPPADSTPGPANLGPAGSVNLNWGTAPPVTINNVLPGPTGTAGVHDAVSSGPTVMAGPPPADSTPGPANLGPAGSVNLNWGTAPPVTINNVLPGVHNAVPLIPRDSTVTVGPPPAGSTPGPANPGPKGSVNLNWGSAPPTTATVTPNSAAVALAPAAQLGIVGGVAAVVLALL